ncbi:MAG: thymidylate synthase (FAD) [Deltaproteobacteria bacterium CG11_big_fil_rev_8_21_14_0_20_49_13]|nr:MAG: thymidylate synthase (FAD) [Deltaproteobacteria bacterium CG11_big_fil_rev_8_21_14_0_20_49_13]
MEDIEIVDSKEGADLKDADIIKCLDHGFVRLVDVMGGDESIVQAARVSYGKGTKNVRQDKGLINYLLKHFHMSPFEMVEFKFHCVGGENRIPTSLGFKKVSESLNAISIHNAEDQAVIISSRNTGKKELFRLHLDRGYFIDVTEDHRVRILDENGKLTFKRASDINNNEHVCLYGGVSWSNGSIQKLNAPKFGNKRTSNIKISFPESLTPELAELTGFYLGDGYLSRAGLEFPVGLENLDTLDHLVLLLRNIFLTEPRVRNDGKIYRVHINSRTLAKWWIDNGFKKDSALCLCVPERIWNSPPSTAYAFLRGLFSADGCITDTNGVALTSACFEFVKEIQQLAHALGIPLSHINRPGAHSLYTWTEEGLKVFSQKVDFWEKKKQQKLYALLAKPFMQRASAIPNAFNLVTNNALVVNGSEAVSHHFRSQLYMNCNLSKNEFIESYNHGYFPEELGELANLLFLKIKNRENLGVQDVYDFHVSSKNQFVCNNVIVHNCKMPIFVARQWIRHRTASVNEISGRYSIMEDTVWRPDPKDLRQQAVINRQGSLDRAVPDLLNSEILATYNNDIETIFKHYHESVDKGLAREVARVALPLSTYTEWYWKMDLNNLLHFLWLRMDQHAQKEIRVYAEAIAVFVKKRCPFTWEAFEEHRLNSVTLSSSEVEALRKAARSTELLERTLEERKGQLKEAGASDALVTTELAELRSKLAGEKIE